MAKRLYDSVRWRRERRDYLFDNPLCVLCLEMGREVLAVVVDHKKPHRGDEDLFWDHDNWQALCETCHDSAKQRKEKGGILPGCSVDGIPLDPDHPWRKP